MEKRLIQIAGFLLAAAGLHAQTEVAAGVMRGKDYGVTYMLPKTVIELTVQATKHTYIPGELCKYAARYLRIDNVAGEQSVYWTMEGVKTASGGVPDKERTYFVKLKDKTTAPLMELTEDGIIRSINLPYSGGKKDVPVSPTTPAKEIDPRTFLTEEMLMANSIAKRAELVAKEIYNIRESKNALLRGEADFMPSDGTQLQIMLDNLNQQEKIMTEMFTGKIIDEPQTSTIRLEPQETDKQVAFRFSKHIGVVDSGNLAGEPVYISLKNMETPGMLAETENKKEPEGIAYNVPGRAHVTVVYGNKTLFDGDLPVTQFGSIEYLAPVMFNKNNVTKILFDTATGGLLKIERAEEK